MNEEKSFVMCEDVVVPGPVVRVEHGNLYGSVPGLDDAELLGPAELERAVYRQEFGPVLALPVKGSRGSGIRPVVDESGGVDFGAFGTVDFDRWCLGRLFLRACRLRDEIGRLEQVSEVRRQRRLVKVFGPG